MYKIIRDEFDNSENTIHRISTNTFITAFSGSEGWEQFVDDIFTNGIGINAMVNFSINEYAPYNSHISIYFYLRANY